MFGPASGPSALRPLPLALPPMRILPVRPWSGSLSCRWRVPQERLEPSVPRLHCSRTPPAEWPVEGPLPRAQRGDRAPGACSVLGLFAEAAKPGPAATMLGFVTWMFVLRRVD